MIELSKLKGRRIALMGGAGFIGHNLALRLKELGAEPHVIDGLQVNNLGYLTSGYIKDPNAERYIAFINERLALLRQVGVGLHILDIRDYHQVSHAIAALKPDCIIHLAAIAHANRSNKDPFSTFDHSLRTLENVLDISKDSGIHIIYFSSSMVYGNFDGAAVEEDRQCNPIGIYGALKYGAEKLVLAYSQVFSLPYTIIRPSALYGERCVSRRVGQAFIENALLGKTLTINGDGKDALDFTYIEDLIQGVILAIINNNAINEIFNITYGNGRQIIELAEIVKSEFEKVDIKFNPRDGLMPERGTLSIEKAKNLLGYKPTFSIDIGYKNYINWYRDFAISHPEYFEQKNSAFGQ